MQAEARVIGQVLAGAAAGALVVGVLAWRAKVNYENQGAALAAQLASSGQQTAAALQAGGTQFKTALEALARAQAQASAIGRASTLLRAYGLDSTTLAKLERYQATLT